MVLKADQERVKTLLKDTITLLCRNGLTFKSKFSIEALIGVTLDDDDVFLVSINELIQTEKAHVEGEEEDELEKESECKSVANSPQSPSESQRQRKRKRAHVKTEASQSGDDDSGGGGDEENSSGSEQEDRSQSPAAEPESKRTVHMKQETVDDGEDIVFIKEEPKETVWQQEQTETLFSDMNNAANSSLGSDQNFPSLADMNLVPVASQEDSALWNANQTNQMMAQLPLRGYKPRGPRTSTITSGSTGDGNMDTSQSQAGHSKEGSRCDICGKCFCTKSSLKRHSAIHSGHYKFVCPLCGLGFVGRYYLNTHMKAKHSAVKVYSCGLCHSSFGYKSNLKYHLKRFHARDSDDVTSSTRIK